MRYCLRWRGGGGSDESTSGFSLSLLYWKSRFHLSSGAEKKYSAVVLTSLTIGYPWTTGLRLSCKTWALSLIYWEEIEPWNAEMHLCSNAGMCLRQHQLECPQSNRCGPYQPIELLAQRWTWTNCDLLWEYPTLEDLDDDRPSPRDGMRILSL